MDEATLMKQFPEVEWAVPIQITMSGDQLRLVCKMCIKLKGLNNQIIKSMPTTGDEFNKHLIEEHRINPEEYNG
jgi:hypothetical protein